MEPLNNGNKRCFTITTHSFLLYRHQKNEFFWEFSGILEGFWRILDISKKNFRAFPGNSGKNFWPYFGNYVAKPSLHANSRSRQSTAKLFRQRNVFHGRNSFPYLGRFSKVQPELKPWNGSVYNWVLQTGKRSDYQSWMPIISVARA